MTVSEQAVKSLRDNGPMTAWQLAAKQQWPLRKAKQGIYRGRNMAQVRRVAKTRYAGRFIYGAVQP